MKRILKTLKFWKKMKELKMRKRKKEGQISSSDIGEKIKLNEDYLYDVIN